MTVKQLQSKGVRILRLVYSDLYGVQRGKDVLLSRAAHALGHGKPFVEAVMTIDHAHNIVSGEEAGFRDFAAVPDLSTARIDPFDPEVAVVLCDLVQVPGGEPADLDPRGALKRVTARLARKGLNPVVAHELEFYLLERNPDGVGGLAPMPMRNSCVYTVGALADPERIARRMFDACEAFGLDPISMAQEYGHSQHEINLTHGPAVEATDRAFLFKTLVKQVAAQDGVVATFMGMPVDDDEASGFHLHVSLVDKAGRNRLDQPRGTAGLSPAAYHFTAGVIAHGRGLCGVLNPTVNAYKRIINGGLSPKFANWGHDNRMAMVRFCTERGPATRIEVRNADGSANPYLVATAVLAAGLDGIERKLEPPAPVEGNFYEGPEDLIGEPLPTSLGEALDALEADEVLVDALGARLAETYLRNKRYELDRWTAHLNRLTAWEMDEYAEAL